jgi:serine/threonine protein kinase
VLTPLTGDDPRTIGPYRLRNRIGAGGMGVVYLGFDSERRPAAVKVPHLNHATNAEFRKRFRIEVSAARGVVGASVARVIAADADAPRPWLAAEYVEGPNLQAAIDRGGPLAGDELDRLVLGLAEAIAEIHRAGVIHRDLKPENILLSPTGPKVVDFGIARSVGFPGITEVGEMIGTVAWMAPEQVQVEGRTAGPPVDVFAWGSCIVFAATGRRPFPGESPRSIAAALQIVNSEPILDGVPDRLLPAVRAALAKSPDRRPTATDLLEMLAGLRPSARNNTGSRRSDDSTVKLPRNSSGLLPPVSRHPGLPSATELTDRPRSDRPRTPRNPRSTFLFFVVAGCLFAAGIGLAVTNAPFGDPVGLAAVAGAVTLVALVLTTPSGVFGIVMIALASAIGATPGLALSRSHHINQPNRILLQLAGAVILAAVYALIMNRRPRA